MIYLTELVKKRTREKLLDILDKVVQRQAFRTKMPTHVPVMIKRPENTKAQEKLLNHFEKHHATKYSKTQEWVPVDKIVSGQDKLDAHHLARHIRNPDLKNGVDHNMAFVHHGGQYHEAEGHHRAHIAKYVDGETHVLADVYRRTKF